MATLWTCPYCNRPCTIGSGDISTIGGHTYISAEYGHYWGRIHIIVCPASDCRKHTLTVAIHKFNNETQRTGDNLHFWSLLPESEAKVFPDYIPEAIIADYREACLIKTKSPKASATLSRRCLQGMIRDFWKISDKTLFQEINALKTHVDGSTWEAMDAVRKVGNIGAHMEQDVNVVIDVEPEEAGLLIGLIETLFREWYIAKHDKEARMKALTNLAAAKTAAKSPPKA